MLSVILFFSSNLWAGQVENEQQLKASQKAFTDFVNESKKAGFHPGFYDARVKSGGQDKKRRARYAVLRDEVAFWTTVVDLQHELVNMAPSSGDEASVMASQLVSEILRLNKTYKVRLTPWTQNLLINMKLAKRGFCRHWAEDLTHFYEDHFSQNSYFGVIWAEAHAHSIREHNTMVIIPKGGELKEGLVIDPWRTGGKPFWIRVKDDHYPWQIWKVF